VPRTFALKSNQPSAYPAAAIAVTLCGIPTIIKKYIPNSQPLLAPVAATSDQGKAARRLMTDDGFNIGVLYRGSRRPYAPAGSATHAPADLEKEFAL